MNLAVMQPYLFPYIGYFQLIYACDTFLIYDDVSYIKQGYINRNTILMGGQPLRFTVPVPGASSNKLIYELSYATNVEKTLRTISQAYAKAPYFSEVFPIIKRILEHNVRSIPELCLTSFLEILSYLKCEKPILLTSRLEYDRALSAQDRLIQLCKNTGAECYINPIGGSALYTKQAFAEHEIELLFLRPKIHEYNQGNGPFHPSLSIIDCLMNCPPSQVSEFISDSELL